MCNHHKVAVIIGAGPAGLTAAYELLERTNIKPIVLEASGDIGGIAKTVVYKGNRIDIGPHRFFSKSDRVMDWWENILPLQGKPALDDIILKRAIPLSRKKEAPDPETSDKVMLYRKRLTRILYAGKFFDYPITFKTKTIFKLGFFTIFKIGFSYLKSRLFPIREEKSLEDFFINRFGRALYLAFFKDYTEKLWGVPCSDIKADWGAQRIKALSISKALWHAVRNIFFRNRTISQKNVETSLIGQFLYPKLGAGQMWQEVARQIEEKGGQIHLFKQVIGIEANGHRIGAVNIRDVKKGTTQKISGDYFFSSMPVKDLISAFEPEVPPKIADIAKGLTYRDLILCAVLLKKIKPKKGTSVSAMKNSIPDSWIYIQEPGVKVGRIQIYNNWSPYMLRDRSLIWIGMEYFCNKEDDLWNMNAGDFISMAAAELQKIDLIDAGDFLDGTLLRIEKAYPGYFGSFNRFDLLRGFLDQYQNLFLVGRNGMHRYNNSDHSMLTSMTAVDNIIKGVTSKENIWDVNAEQEYLEQK